MGRDIAVLEGEAGGLVGVLSALGGDGVLLSREGLAGEDQTVLEDDCAVAKDEVDSAGYLGFTVELAKGVGVEGVLVAVNAAAEEGREVGVRAECDCLMLGWTGRVLKGHVPGDEAPG